jgi:peptide deformylase
MTLLTILTAPDPVLKKKAVPVAEVGDRIRLLMDNMLETMYAAPGIGLAAPQVGVSERVVVIDVGRSEENRQPLFLVNPQISWASDEDNVYEEGCLSVPELYGEVVRPKAVRVTYLDRDNNPGEIEADGLLATVIQHEMDHLDGILFIDHLTSLKRNMILRKLLKLKKDAAADK